VTRLARFGSLALLALAPIGLGLGCSETTTTSVNPTPPAVLAPTAPDEAPTAPAPKDAGAAAGGAADASSGPAPSATTAITPVDLAALDPAPETAPAPSAPDGVTLTPVKYDELLSRIASNKAAKFTLVDVWATWCPPCLENFPHVVAMHDQYADQGLAVASLSFDDTTDPNAMKKARAFLQDKKAVFPNYVLDEPTDVAFEKFDMTTIPAVFLFGPDGKVITRYTWDDPNKQFTYEQVERDVVAMLQGKPAPGPEAAKPDARKDDAKAKAETKPEAAKAEAPAIDAPKAEEDSPRD
jgi:thiol-disulfide isomerase/thioredoxin